MLMVFCGFGIRDLDRKGKEYSKGWGWVKLKERGWRELKNERTKKEVTEAACLLLLLLVACVMCLLRLDE